MRKFKLELNKQAILKKAVSKILKMTSDEIKQLSIRAGIHNADGSLRPEYKPKHNKKKV